MKISPLLLGCTVLLLGGFVLAQESTLSGTDTEVGQELTINIGLYTGLVNYSNAYLTVENPSNSGTSESNIVQHELSENFSTGMLGGIIIKEIFAKDTAFLGEYIILESHISYSGAVEVVGAGQGTASKTINIQVLPGELLLFTDSPEKIIQWSGKLLFQSSITLTDSGEELLIKISGDVIDHVIYQTSPSDVALFYTETDIYGRRNFTTFNTPTPHYILPPISASGNNLSGATSSGLVHSGSYSSTGIVDIDTGDIILYPEIDSGTICTQPINYGTVVVSEIHPFDTDQFPEFIELFVQGTLVEPISIIGLGQGQSAKAVNLSGLQQRIIITDHAEYFPTPTSVIELSSISLTDGGESLQVLGQSGQVFDIAVYTAGIEGKSLYFSGLDNVGMFSHTDYSSPGFDLSQVTHLFFDNNFTKFYSCSIDLQHDDPFFAGRKINLIASTNNRQLQNSTDDFYCKREFPETDFIFTGCNPGFYDYHTGGLFSVKLELTNVQTNQICETTLKLNYPLNPTEGKVCKETYYNELYLKRKSKFEYLKKGLSEFGLVANATGDISQKSSSTGQQLSIWTGKVNIVSILPNPSGKDDNRESITLHNTDTIPYELQNMFLFNGKSKKKFPPETPTLLPGQQLSVTATLGLTNRPTCIKIQDKTTVHTLFCYPEAKDDQVFTTSTDGLQVVAQHDSKLLNQITVALEETQACALFDKQQVICKALRFADSVVKEYKTQAKKAISLEKKLVKETARTNSYKKKYTDTKIKKAEDKKQYTNKIKTLKLTEQQVRRQLKLLQGYNYLIIEELEGKRRDLYMSSHLPKLRSLYTNLLASIKENHAFIAHSGIELPSEDIELIYGLTQQGELPLHSSELTQFYHSTLEKSQQSVDELLKNLTIGRGVDPPNK